MLRGGNDMAIRTAGTTPVAQKAGRRLISKVFTASCLAAIVLESRRRRRRRRSQVVEHRLHRRPSRLCHSLDRQVPLVLSRHQPTLAAVCF